MAKPDPIQPLPIPQRGEPQDDFNTKMNGFVDGLSNSAIVGINEHTDYVDAKSIESEDSAARAASSAISASATANAKGNWSALSGVLNIPASVYHKNSTWGLRENLLDVTQFEPGVSDKWHMIDIGNGTNMLLNHNFTTPSPDAITHPGANPTDYAAGTQIFSGVTIGADVVGLTYIDGRVSFTGSGNYQFKVPNTSALARVPNFVASVADYNGKPRLTGVSHALVGDEYIITVGATATDVFSVKFEQGERATGHEADGDEFNSQAANLNAKNISYLSSSVDNRSYIYSLDSDVYIGKGRSVRCNLLPDDDVRIFKGDGVVLSLDTWGHEHVFDVAASNKRFNQNKSAKQVIYSKLLQDKNPRIGLSGDSISSGDDADSWSPNPIDGNGNLNSTNYDHDSNGGANGFFAVFRDYSGSVTGVDPKRPVETFNASRSGQKLIDGWAYRNFDYGYFQNDAYANAAPNVVFLSMGHNDSILTEANVNEYTDAFDAFMAKCAGYGSAVALVSTSMADTRNDGNESFKDMASKLYGVDWYDLGSALIEYAFSGKSTVDDIYFKGPAYTDYDFTHPLQIGHTFMGLRLLADVFNTRITEFRHGEVAAGIRTAKHISYNASDKVKANTNSLQFTDEPYLSDFGPVGKTTTSGNTAFDFVIDNKVVGGVLNVIIPRPAATSPTIAPATIILKNSSGEYTKGVDGDRNGASGYYVMTMPELDLGVNVITVYYDKTGIVGNVGAYAPMLSVTKPVKSSSLSQYFPNIGNDTVIAITDVEDTSRFHHDRYDGSIGSRMSDRDTEARYGVISVQADYIQGMRYWIARKPDITDSNGTYVEFTDSSTLTVKNHDGTVLATRSGLTITDTVKFRIKVVGNLIYLLAEGSQVGGWQRRGGLMYLENKSGSGTGDYSLDVSTAFTFN